MNYGTNTDSHRRYLNTYMVQNNKKDIKEKPEVFGNISSEEYNEVRKKTSTGYKNKNSLHFKFIVSPEKQLNPDELKAFTKVLIKQMEQDTGFKFNWQAAVHTNTEHNHIHILINGVDQTGKKIRFKRNFIQDELRLHSSEILTQMYGEREPEAIIKARTSRCSAERFTEYDEVILNSLHKNDDHPGFIGSINIKDGVIGERLNFLKEHGLAEFYEGEYYIKQGMEKTLRTIGRYNTFAEARKIYGDSKLKLYEAEIGSIKGRITKIFNMNDENIWTNAMIVETKDKTFYVPLHKPVSESLINKNILYETTKTNKGKTNGKIIILKDKDDNSKTTFKKSINKNIDNNEIER